MPGCVENSPTSTRTPAPDAAAERLDRVATEEGPWVTWCTQDDDRVEEDCRSLEGSVFTLDRLPLLEGREVFRGSVHMWCRCYPRGLFASSGPLPVITQESVPVNLDLVD